MGDVSLERPGERSIFRPIHTRRRSPSMRPTLSRCPAAVVCRCADARLSRASGKPDLVSRLLVFEGSDRFSAVAPWPGDNGHQQHAPARRRPRRPRHASHAAGSASLVRDGSPHPGLQIGRILEAAATDQPSLRAIRISCPCSTVFGEHYRATSLPIKAASGFRAHMCAHFTVPVRFVEYVAISRYSGPAVVQQRAAYGSGSPSPSSPGTVRWASSSGLKTVSYRSDDLNPSCSEALEAPLGRSAPPAARSIELFCVVDPVPPGGQVRSTLGRGDLLPSAGEGLLGKVLAW